MDKSAISRSQYETSISSHYGRSDLADALLSALQRAGKDIDGLTANDLAPFEEIHIRGRDATRDLARLAGLTEGTRVLDVGCGIGGPARTLAVKLGCRVTGLDLTESYIHAGQMLDERVGLANEVALHVGNALDMPFDDGSFDVVWMQHMAVNIEDKNRLYHEAHRVLRSHGRLALHEILAGPLGSPHFPVPWANDPSISFLANASDLRALLTENGFVEAAWSDDTPKCIEWYRAFLDPRKPGKPPTGLDLVLGENFSQKAQNVLRNLEEQRIEVVQAVFKPQT